MLLKRHCKHDAPLDDWGAAPAVTEELRRFLAGVNHTSDLLALHNFVVTPGGSDITAQIAAAVFSRAS